MSAFKHPRGTRAALVALAAANGLVPWQVYALSDESGRLVIATATNAFSEIMMKSDAPKIHVGTSAPSDTTSLWVDTN